MIVSVRAKNCFSFEEKVELSLEADMRNKRLASNVFEQNGFHILKTAGIYGPNNVGKTCLIKCIQAIKQILLNQDAELSNNFFSTNSVCELGVTFLSKGRKFSYDFHYNVLEKEFIYEKFVEIQVDQYGNQKDILWLFLDRIEGKYKCNDDNLAQLFPVVARNKLLCYMVDTKTFQTLDELKNLIKELADQIDIVTMNNIPMSKTIELMKNHNDIQQKIVAFIKNADLYLENYEYVDIKELQNNIQIKAPEGKKPDEDALKITSSLINKLCLVSTYKKSDQETHVPSLLFDSTGTKKIAAIASYIIEALEQGRILIIDELDSSLHFKLTRAIVAMFHNELNDNAQLIFTVHNINLMDCKKLFRKEQVWFIHKDSEGVYLYSLSDFTAQKGIRDTTDIIAKYNKGVLGALPEPNFLYSLLDIKGNFKKGDAPANEESAP